MRLASLVASNVTNGSPICDSLRSSQPGRPTDFTSVTNIVMVALSDGTLNFYQPTGELVTSYSATHVVQEAVFDGAELPMLVTAGTDGTVLFHNLTLWKNDVVLVGRRPKSVIVEGEFNENGSPKRKRPNPPKEKVSCVHSTLSLRCSHNLTPRLA